MNCWHTASNESQVHARHFKTHAKLQLIHMTLLNSTFSESKQKYVKEDSCQKSFQLGMVSCFAPHLIQGPGAQPAPAALSCSLSLWRAAAASSLAARCFRKSLPMTPSQSWLSSSCKSTIDITTIRDSLEYMSWTPFVRIRKLTIRLQKVFLGPLDGVTHQGLQRLHTMIQCA